MLPHYFISFFSREWLFVTGCVARGVLPSGLLPAAHHRQLLHLGEGEMRGEPGEPVHHGGQGVRGEVLAVHDHLQKTSERAPVQRK